MFGCDPDSLKIRPPTAATTATTDPPSALSNGATNTLLPTGPSVQCCRSAVTLWSSHPSSARVGGSSAPARCWDCGSASVPGGSGRGIFRKTCGISFHPNVWRKTSTGRSKVYLYHQTFSGVPGSLHLGLEMLQDFDAFLHSSQQ